LPQSLKVSTDCRKSALTVRGQRRIGGLAAIAAAKPSKKHPHLWIFLPEWRE
jgi:hypothetical protein